MSKDYLNRLDDDDSSEVASFFDNKGRSTTYITQTSYCRNPSLNYSSSLRTLNYN